MYGPDVVVRRAALGAPIALLESAGRIAAELAKWLHQRSLDVRRLGWMQIEKVVGHL